MSDAKCYFVVFRFSHCVFGAVLMIIKLKLVYNCVPFDAVPIHLFHLLCVCLSVSTTIIFSDGISYSAPFHSRYSHIVEHCMRHVVLPTTEKQKRNFQFTDFSFLCSIIASTYLIFVAELWCAILFGLWCNRLWWCQIVQR